MKTYKVTGYYTVTKYIERIVNANDADEAERKAWSEHYVREIETGEDRDSFEVTEDTVEINSEGE
ncbi:hypothetical protein C2W58_01916 [Bacillus pumilus]|uniref:hypothetical protein n=1 Tax=Bacillus pumilus TaxID=1408 RepID=UPI000DC528F7|nr:hypothetical protein [Bacillus pumilus]RAP05485.1 hypothetical protein C2W58_01916 [Bacillus pumilus]